MRTATINAVVAADEMIVVVDCGFYAFYGLTDLMRRIARVSDAYEKDQIVIRGLILRKIMVMLLRVRLVSCALSVALKSSAKKRISWHNLRPEI